MECHKPSKSLKSSRLSRKALSLVTALSVGAALATVSSQASAEPSVPSPRTPSAYNDNYGRNVIGEEKLEQLKPSVTGGEKTVKVGDHVAYEYKVKTGFPNDPNNVTAQRWMRLTLTENPQVPFDKDVNGLPKVEGLPADSKIEKVEGDDHSWRVVLGAEYLDMDKSGARVNNPQHYQWKNDSSSWDKHGPWNPPESIDIKVPAVVAGTSGDGFASGKMEVVSGRLADIELQDNIEYKFIENNGKGLCKWEAHYETQLTKDDASYWLQNVTVFSDPESTEDFVALPYRYKGLTPNLIRGEVKVNGQKYKDLQRITPKKSQDFPGYEIGELVVTDKVPPFFSEKWILPKYPVEVDFIFENPCGEKVTEQVVKDKPRFIAGYGNGLVPEYTFVQASGAYVGMIRPPEDASDSAEFKFIKEEKKGSVSVGDFVWIDANKNGIQDSDEKGLADVELELSYLDGSPVTDVHGQPVRAVKTGADGKYLFKDLPIPQDNQRYRVTVGTVPNGYVPTQAEVGNAREKDSSTKTSDATVLSKDGDSDLTLDFGFVKEEEPVAEPGSVSVGDYVWFDANANGVQDQNEKGLAGVTLELQGPDGQQVTDIDGAIVEKVVTEHDGKYRFSNLPILTEGQKYKVVVSDYPEGYEPTVAASGDDIEMDSSTGWAETGKMMSVDGAVDNSLDFGFVQTDAPWDGKWWLSLIPLAVIPLIPLIGGHAGSSAVPTSPVPPQQGSTKQQGPSSQSQPDKQQATSQKPANKQLAATGAGVLGILAMAIACITAGVFLVRSRKNS